MITCTKQRKFQVGVNSQAQFKLRVTKIEFRKVGKQIQDQKGTTVTPNTPAKIKQYKTEDFNYV